MQILQAIGPFSQGQRIQKSDFSSTISLDSINNILEDDLWIDHVAIEFPQAPPITEVDSLDKMYSFTIRTKNSHEFVINACDILEFESIARSNWVNINAGFNLKWSDITEIIPNQNISRYAIITLGVYEKKEQ